MNFRIFCSKERCLKLIFTGIFFYCLLLCVNFTVNGEEIKDNDLYSKSCVLIDGKTGRVLYGKEAFNEMAMASTTKIMTCIIALENAQLDMVAEVSEYAASMPEVSLGMCAGEKYVLEDLLYSLMLESHNDTAVAIAEAVAGSVEKFADMMNEKAIELGCKNTFFITPNGLDKEINVKTDIKKYHHTTAWDLARIMSYCINKSPKSEEFLNITRKEAHTFRDIAKKRQFTCNNHNSFLNMMDGALTGKTGFTNKAGYCYVGALRRDNMDFVVALLACGWPNNKNYKWSDTKLLMNYGLENYNLRKIAVPYEKIQFDVNKGQYNIQNEEIKKTFGNVSFSSEKYLMKDNEEVDIQYEIMENIEAPLMKGEKIGDIIYFINDYEVYRGDIVAAEEVLDKNILWAINELLLAFFSLSFII